MKLNLKKGSWGPLAGTLGVAMALTACNGSGDSSTAAASAGADSSSSVGSVVAEPVTPAPVPSAAPTSAPSSAPTATPTENPAPEPTQTPSSAAIGASCHSDDANKMCLSLRFVVYQNSSGKAIMSQATALSDLDSMNKIWSKCNIAFEIGEFLVVDPAKYGLDYTITSSSELEKVRADFDVSDMLLGVTAGPWQISANAWTNMPGAQYYGAVFDGSVADFGPIYAHEFGHYLGLDHVSDTSDVMTPVIYSSSTNLTTSQCTAARNTVMQYWSKMLR